MSLLKRSRIGKAIDEAMADDIWLKALKKNYEKMNAKQKMAFITKYVEVEKPTSFTTITKLTKEDKKEIKKQWNTKGLVTKK